jgi:hypothetical protein
MRIIPFPSQRQPPGQEAWNADLDAALAGELRGPTAEAWRELREDVRSLAQPMTPAFEARLREELERRGALGESAAQAEAPPRRRFRLGLARRRSLLLGATAAAVAALALALALATPPGSRSPSATPGSSSSAARAQNAPASGALASGRADEMGASPAPTASAPSTARAAGAAAPSASGEAASGGTPGRVQQLAASITLSAAPESVQAVSDQVAQIAVHDGGYVQTSNVRVQQQGTSASSPGGEATLALRLPSARLGAALAAIGRLSPVDAQSQSLEDITNSYDAAHQQLNDALAERQALLHALAAATTEGQIDSLRERLSENRGAITRAQASVNSVSRRASTAEVEVSVLGDQHNSGTSGLSLHSGLHDAERVLVAVVSALLIALAALVPLGLVLAALLGARRAWRRVQRERALDAT